MTKQHKPQDLEYLIECHSMTPKERFLKGIELSEWSMLINKNHKAELKNRLKNTFVLK